MKIKPHAEIVANVRLAIKQTQEALIDNKASRKSLIKEICKLKNGIRGREAMCSKMDEAGISSELARTDLRRLREQLNNLRQNLLGAEVYRATEIAKYRALHGELDRMKVPFDPVRKSQKDGSKND